MDILASVKVLVSGSYSFNTRKMLKEATTDTTECLGFAREMCLCSHRKEDGIVFTG